MKSKDYEGMEEELKKRISAIKSTEDNGVIRMSKKDYCVAAVITLLCFLSVIGGALL